MRVTFYFIVRLRGKSLPSNNSSIKLQPRQGLSFYLDVIEYFVAGGAQNGLVGLEDGLDNHHGVPIDGIFASVDLHRGCRLHLLKLNLLGTTIHIF